MGQTETGGGADYARAVIRAGQRGALVRIVLVAWERLGRPAGITA